MNTKKTAAFSYEERLPAFEKETRQMAVACWELAKKCCWPQKQFDEKMNSTMIHHIAFLLALETDPYAAYQNCCNNILEHYINKDADALLSATEKKEQRRIFLRSIFENRMDMDLSKGHFKSALPYALLEMIETSAEEISHYWNNWFTGRNKIKEGELFESISRQLIHCKKDFL